MTIQAGATIGAGSSLQTSGGTFTLDGVLDLGTSTHTLNADSLVSGTGSIDADQGNSASFAAGLTIGQYFGGSGTLTFDGPGSWSTTSASSFRQAPAPASPTRS